MSEQDYTRGSNAAHRNMMLSCMKHLDVYPTVDMEKKVVSLIAERDEAVGALRDLCKSFGDNDWPDELHLADIIEKHLARHLHSS